MAIREAVVNVKVNAPQTLGQLEEELNGINEELKKVPANSKKFQTLTKQFQKADFAIKQLQSNIDGTLSTKRSDAAKKLGEGLVGGFAAATSAAALFGDQSSEAFQKAQAKAVLLFTAMDGLDKVTKAFSKETIDGLKSSGQAMLKFAKTTKGALIATGLGIFIVAVGLLAANWDWVTEKVGEFKDEIITVLKFIAPPLGFLIAGVQSLIDTFGSLEAVIAGVGGAIKEFFDFSSDKTLKEAFEEAATAAQKIVDAEKELKIFEDETKKNNARKIQELEALGAKEEEITKIKVEELEREIKLRTEINKKNDAKSKAFKEEDNAIKDLQTNLLVINAREATRLETINKGVASEKEKNLELRKQIKLLEEQRQIELSRLGVSVGDLILQKELLEKRLELYKNEGVPLERAKIIALEMDDIDRRRYTNTQNIILLENERAKQIENNAKAIAEASKALQEIGITEKQRLERIKVLNEAIAKDKSDTLQSESKLVTLQNERLGIEIQTIEFANELSDIAGEELAEQNRIIKLLKEKKKLNDKNIEQLNRQAELLSNDFGDSLRAANDYVREQHGLWSESASALDIFLEKTADIALALSKLGEFAAVGFEAMLVSLDNQLLESNKKLTKIRKEQQKFNDEEIDYQALLKDANGEKFEEIETAMVAQEDLRTDLAQQEVDLQNKIIDGENEQAKIQKQQAVVDSIIQTALAAVSALPNVPLSIIVAALGLAGTATIAAKKIPLQEHITLESKAEGGYTAEGGKNDVKGVVHGSEYVVPTDILQTAFGGEMVALLEGMRTGMRGFAEGGFTDAPAPSVPSLASGSGFDTQPIYVSVKEIREVGRNVDVIETKSSL